MTQPTQQRTPQNSRNNNPRPSNQRNSGRGNSRPSQQGSSGSRQGKGSKYAGKKSGRGPAKPFRKPAGPVKEYISACCSLPAIKPICGKLEAVVNPETKKTKQAPKGLGHWRCTGCRKGCKVIPRKPAVVEATPAPVPENGVA